VRERVTEHGTLGWLRVRLDGHVRRRSGRYIVRWSSAVKFCTSVEAQDSFSIEDPLGGESTEN